MSSPGDDDWPVELADETDQRLVLEVDDPRATVESIERAVSER